MSTSASTQQMPLSTKGFGTGINVEDGMSDSILIDFLEISIQIFRFFSILIESLRNGEKVFFLLIEVTVVNSHISFQGLLSNESQHKEKQKGLTLKLFRRELIIDAGTVI